jgi:predicted RNA-binding Zn ribbon-like protein
LLNTAWIPNDTRQRRDDLVAYLRRRRLSDTGSEALADLRDGLREVLDHPERIDHLLNSAVTRFGIGLTIEGGRVTFRHSGGMARELLTVVLHAVQDGTWMRLKACPDCEWVFYDHSRNASKRWCVMTASNEGGRSCGTLAKVRAFRKRQSQMSK